MTIGDVAISAVLVLCALTILYPFYNAIMISIVPMHVYVRNPAILWPEEIVLDSYRFVLSYHAIWSGLKVTGIVTLAGTAYNMLLTVITAYVLTKTFPGKRLVQAMMIIPLYFGGGLVPYYLLIRDLGLIDSIWSMIVPTGLNYTYMLIVMRYIEGLPRELEEAAEIDGAGQVKKLFIKSAEKQPLQLVLRNLVQDSTDASLDAQANGMTESYSDAIKMASIVITMVPILVLYPFLQRYFLSDLTQGAVKG